MVISEYQIIDKVLDVPLTTGIGQEFFMGAYKTSHNGNCAEHSLIYKGKIVDPKKPILLRINSACYTSDIFDCQRCDCNWQLKKAMEMVNQHGGLIIYHFHHEGRAFGFTNKLKTIKDLEKQGKLLCKSTLESHEEIDNRKYLSAIKILKDLKISKVKLITNNLLKEQMLECEDIDVIERIPIVSGEEHLKEFLLAKRDIFGNIIDFDDDKKK